MKKLTIAKKLLLMGALIVVSCAGLSLAGFWGLVQLEGTVASITVNTAAVRNHMQADMMHDALRGDVLEALRIGEKGTAEEKQEIQKELAEHVKKFQEALKENESQVTSPEAQKALQDAAKPLAAYIARATAIVNAAFVDHVAAAAQMNDFKSKFAELESVMEKIGDLLENNAKTAQGESANLSAISKWVMAGTATVLLLVAGGFLFAITRSITGSLREVVAIFQDIAQGEGDLTRRLQVTGEDEFGQMATWFNMFMEKLHRIVVQVKSTVGEVADASRQLSSASDQLSSGAQEQAASLEQTAASMEKIADTVKLTADNSRQANQLAVGARETAEQGGQVVQQAVGAMGEINKASKKIADIITTIDEIAFQTNLLALNAAVEAARAGEQGRGFAVVAAEVRNLAQRSAAAAREIKTLIQDSVNKVETGSALVNKSGQTLEEIVTSVKRVTDIVAEIAAAGQEQSSGIDQIHRAITSMDQVTQSNAAQTEELTSTAQTLASQSEELMVLVAQFKLADAGLTKADHNGNPRVATRPQNVARAKVTPRILSRPDGSRRAAAPMESGFEEF